MNRTYRRQVEDLNEKIISEDFLRTLIHLKFLIKNGESLTPEEVDTVIGAYEDLHEVLERSNVDVKTLPRKREVKVEF